MSLTIFAKYSILVVWESSQYAYEKYLPEACLEPNKTSYLEFFTVIFGNNPSEIFDRIQNFISIFFIFTCNFAKAASESASVFHPILPGTCSAASLSFPLSTKLHVMTIYKRVTKLCVAEESRHETLEHVPFFLLFIRTSLSVVILDM